MLNFDRLNLCMMTKMAKSKPGAVMLLRGLLVVKD